MATLKTHILSVQFKLLRSKEGHLIFWAQNVLTTFDFQNIRTINQPAVCLLKPWLPSEREAGHWHAALCLHNFKSEEVMWCKPLDGSLHCLRRRVWSLSSRDVSACVLWGCALLTCLASIERPCRMTRASQGHQNQFVPSGQEKVKVLQSPEATPLAHWLCITMCFQRDEKLVLTLSQETP